MMYEDHTIFGIEEEEGKKIVHFYGYGYYVGEESGKSYRFLEYTFFYAPLEDVLSHEGGFDGYEIAHSDSVKTYITDCTQEELNDIYEHYDCGRKPVEISEKDIASAPLGVYVLK